MKKKFTPFKIAIILSVILLFGLLYFILTFKSQELAMNVFVIMLLIILFFGIIYVLLTNIQFYKDKVILNLYIYTEHNNYKMKFLKGPVIYYKDINRIDYHCNKDNNSKMNVVKIELKDNNKVLTININGYTRLQREQIKMYFNNIFKSRDN